MARCAAILLGLACALQIGGPARTAESFVLPPYLESVVLDILGDEREAAVQVLPPDAPGRPLTAGTAGVEEIRIGQALRTLIIRRPAPGRWTFQKLRPSTRVKVVSRQFSPRGLLLEPTDGKPLQQRERVFLTYQVTDENGALLQELPGYPLSAEIVLVQPGGRRVRLALSRRSSGIFQTQQKVECHLAGRYGAEVLLITRDLAGQRVKVFQDRWSGFWVGPAKSPDTL